MKLTQNDEQALQSVESKERQIADFIRGLVNGYHVALFLSGEGGTGKSYHCERELTRLNAHYVHHNSRLTGRGLVDALEAKPTAIHWIEDAETLLDDKRAIGVLRSACWSQSRARPMVRPIKWTAYKTEINFDFTGGLLVVSNAHLLNSSPTLRALKTRVTSLRLDFTDGEILARMKVICQQGHRFGADSMNADECWTVAEFIVSRLSQLRRNLDLRLLVNGFRDYLLHRDQKTQSPWQDLIAARIAEKPTSYKSRKELAIEDHETASEIFRMDLALTKKIELWRQKTGKSRASFYNALKRAG